MSDKLTVQQRRFVKGLVEGKNLRGATRYAGYISPDYGSVLMKQDNIRTALQAHLHKAGITDSLIAKKLKDGLNAKTVPRMSGGKRYDDQFVRKQFLDVILRIRGDYAPERFESINKQITLVVDDKMLEALKDSKALDAEEIEYLEHTPIKEIKDAGSQEGDRGNITSGEERPADSGPCQESCKAELCGGSDGEDCQSAENDSQESQ